MARGKKKKKSESPIVSMEVDNPDYQPEHHGAAANPKRIKAAFNMRESPVIWMRARGYVTEPQAMAATEFRRLYERSGGAGGKAIDFTREPVDGGTASDSITDARIDALKELSRVKDRLGIAGFDIVQKVCGECVFIKDLAPTKWYQLKLADQLKDCLDVLAVDWGYQTSRIRTSRKRIDRN